MNRYLTPIVFLSFACVPLGGQTVGLCNQVVAPAGQSVEHQGIIYSYTVGETVTLTLSGLGLVLSQGFEQPDLCPPLVGTDAPLGLADWAVQLAPNPTAEVLRVQFSPEKNGGLLASVFDLTGRLVLPERKLSEPSGSELDCRVLPAGAYFLRLGEAASAASGVFRFIKL